MSASTNHVSKLLTFALILICLHQCSLAAEDHVVTIPNLSKVTVHVKNKIAVGRDLDVHCQSKSDDMGVHKLHNMEEYQWTFKVNFWGSTLFWCKFQFHNDKYELVDGSFDIFEYGRDKTRCMRHCYWDIKKEGVFFVDAEGKRAEKMYDWPPGKPDLDWIKGAMSGPKMKLSRF